MNAQTQKMPTLFISHGGPNIVIDDIAARHYLEGLSTLFPRPKAIVIMSAHFEADGVVVVTDPEPEMIYDFGGFAPELYQMQYPAPGDPELAMRVVRLLDEAGLEPATLGKRGYDHGVWTPLKLAFPQADIPIVQLSIDPHRDAAWHHAVGAALSTLRAEGVLLIGSGHITHNLRAYFSAARMGRPIDPEMPGKVNAFRNWFADRFENGDRESILDWKGLAPYPLENHPTDEHLMPLLFAFGAAGEGAHAERVHDSVEQGFFAYDSWLFQ